MSKMILYHGSNEKIEKPIFGKGKVYNDYGQGFYRTEHIELAKEWACNEGVDGFANKYELDLTDLEILNLSEERCTILHWLALLMENRLFRVTAPVMRRGEQYVLKSEKAFHQIEFKAAELADNTIYYARRKIRDDEARNAFFTEFEKEDLNGIYMRDIIREGMTSDDARLR